MNRYGILFLVLALVACQDEARVWYKGGASQSDYQRDTYECERDTRMSVPQGFTMSVYGQLEAEQFFVRCMNTKGYYLIPASQAYPVRPIMPTTGPPPPMRDAKGVTYSGDDMVLCKFPNVEPVKFSARTCTQGHGTIVGSATQ